MPLEKHEALEPIVLHVDLSEAWDTESEGDIVIESLKKAGIYGDHLLFSGFDGKNPAKTEGKIFCSSEESLRGDINIKQNPIDYAMKRKTPALAIYDKNKVINSIDYQYYFSDASALIAVVFLKK